MTTLSWTTAGESHGPALIAVLEGMPAGLELDLERIDAELARRQGGYGRSKRQSFERDRATLLSGMRAGRTLGSPIAVQLANRDDTIERLPVPTNPRPGHADLAGCHKYGVRDPRAVLERASARETAARVAVAGIARQLLEAFGVELFAHVVELGGVAARPDALEEVWSATPERRTQLRSESAFYTLDPEVDARLRDRVDAAREAGDTLGGIFEVRVLGLPPGLGGYARPSDRLTARIGAALFSIPAMKGVEFGLGFDSARRPGSAVQDAIEFNGAGAPGSRYRRRTNRAGGLEGGLTTGEPLVVRVAMKPIPTLRQGIDSVDFASGEAVRATYQRSDVTAVPAASVVGEAMVALVLATAFREQFGGDSIDQMGENVGSYLRKVSEV